VEADDPAALRHETRLRLLSLLASFFGARGITLTTSSESPTGAGLAGVLGAERRRLRRPGRMEAGALRAGGAAAGGHERRGPDDSGADRPADYRPALYGGLAALELEVDGIHRVPLDVDLKELNRRIVLCYTGEPHFSGTNNWEITKKHIDGDRTCSTASSASGTRRSPCAPRSCAVIGTPPAARSPRSGTTASAWRPG
jgi:D-glycero-alpha-D-manno-heptose-7-phosphate kinase